MAGRRTGQWVDSGFNRPEYSLSIYEIINTALTFSLYNHASTYSYSSRPLHMVSLTHIHPTFSQDVWGLYNKYTPICSGCCSLTSELLYSAKAQKQLIAFANFISEISFGSPSCILFMLHVSELLCGRIINCTEIDLGLLRLGDSPGDV